MNRIADFFHQPYGERHLPIANDTLFATVGSIIALIGAEVLERQNPAFSATLKLVPAFAFAIWILKRLPNGNTNNYEAPYVQPIHINNYEREFVAPVPVYQAQRSFFGDFFSGMGRQFQEMRVRYLHTPPPRRRVTPAPIYQEQIVPRPMQNQMYQLPDQRLPLSPYHPHEPIHFGPTPVPSRNPRHEMHGFVPAHNLNGLQELPDHRFPVPAQQPLRDNRHFPVPRPQGAPVNQPFPVVGGGRGGRGEPLIPLAGRR